MTGAFDARAFTAEAEEGMRSAPAGDGGSTAPAWPAWLDLADLAQREPEAPRFIVPAWLPAGYACMLAGHGGAGKSYIGLTLAVCIAAGADWCGIPTERRRVLVLACEDRANVLHWRLARIAEHLGIDLSELAGWLFVQDLVGRDTIVWRPDPGGRSPLAPAYHSLAHRMHETAADVLVVDGVTDAYGGNENDRSQVKAFVNSLLSLIDESNGAVILLAHVNKMTAGSGATGEGYSGSTGWHNAVRARWYLRPEVARHHEDDTPKKTGKLILELQKSNLGRADESITFNWDDAARMFVGRRPETGTLASLREEAERTTILDAIAAVLARGDYVPAASTGPRTAYHVLAATEKLDGNLQSAIAGRKRFWRRIEELRSMKRIREGSIRRADRKMTVTLELAYQPEGGPR